MSIARIGSNRFVKLRRSGICWSLAKGLADVQYMSLLMELAHLTRFAIRARRTAQILRADAAEFGL